jgi:hypothetical protein
MKMTIKGWFKKEVEHVKHSHKLVKAALKAADKPKRSSKITNQIPNFWPDFQSLQHMKLSPNRILAMQARFLKERTAGLIIGHIPLLPPPTVFGPPPERPQTTFNWAFDLFLPTMDYTYRLFEVRHGLDLYPAVIEFFEKDKDEPLLLKAFNPEQFQEQLKKVLAMERTVHVVNALLAQVK